MKCLIFVNLNAARRTPNNPIICESNRDQKNFTITYSILYLENLRELESSVMGIYRISRFT